MNYLVTAILLLQVGCAESKNDRSQSDVPTGIDFGKGASLKNEASLDYEESFELTANMEESYLLWSTYNIALEQTANLTVTSSQVTQEVTYFNSNQSRANRDLQGMVNNKNIFYRTKKARIDRISSSKNGQRYAKTKNFLIFADEVQNSDGNHRASLPVPIGVVPASSERYASIDKPIVFPFSSVIDGTRHRGKMLFEIEGVSAEQYIFGLRLEGPDELDTLSIPRYSRIVIDTKNESFISSYQITPFYKDGEKGFFHLFHAYSSAVSKDIYVLPFDSNRLAEVENYKSAPSCHKSNDKGVQYDCYIANRDGSISKWNSKSQETRDSSHASSVSTLLQDGEVLKIIHDHNNQVHVSSSTMMRKSVIENVLEKPIAINSSKNSFVLASTENQEDVLYSFQDSKITILGESRNPENYQAAFDKNDVLQVFTIDMDGRVYHKSDQSSWRVVGDLKASSIGTYKDSDGSLQLIGLTHSNSSVFTFDLNGQKMVDLGFVATEVPKVVFPFEDERMWMIYKDQKRRLAVFNQDGNFLASNGDLNSIGSVFGNKNKIDVFGLNSNDHLTQWSLVFKDDHISKDDSLPSPPSETVIEKTQESPIDLPENFDGYIRPNGKIELTWTQVSTDVSIRVNRRLDNTGDFEVLHNTDLASKGWRDRSVGSSGIYEYTIQACHESGCSKASKILKFEK